VFVEADVNVVSATVKKLGVQGLVNIADKVDEEH